VKYQQYLEKSNLNTLINEILFYVDDKVFPNTSSNLLNSKIKSAETINLILADGLGYENLLKSNSNLNKNISSFINTTFPSSTNVALATLAFAKLPIEHGILGYYLFDQSTDSVFNALNFNNGSEVFLKNDKFQENVSIWNMFKENKISSNNFQPSSLVNSELSNLLYRKENTIGYNDSDNLVELFNDSLVLENRFNFIYYPNIDLAAHIFGVESKEWTSELNKFENLVEQLSNISNKKCFTIITADHGVVNIPTENRHRLEYDEKIKIYGDQRSVYIKGKEKDVRNVFKDVPGELLTKRDIEYLLGETNDKFLKSYYPDFCFLVQDSHIIYPHHLNNQLVGYHGGLSSKEIKIPLIEISNY
jgi:predicted AlkP superfamily pyrophosphatase or phosphodiesterase